MSKTVCTVIFHGQNVTFWQWNSTVGTDFEHLYRIYSIPTHDKNQWLLLQFIVFLKMDAKRASETCGVSCQNKFVKLVLLFDFITKKKGYEMFCRIHKLP